jgi:hypothetical protein
MVKLFKDTDICKKFTHKDKSKIIHYIELVYSRNSELNNIDSVEDRRIEACRQAGLNPDHVQDIIMQKNDQVNDLIFHYLGYFQNSNEMHQLMAEQQLFWDIQREMMKPVEEDKKEEQYDWKLKMMVKSSDLLNRIKSRKNELFNPKDIGEDTVDIIETKIRILKPEERIKSRSM